MAGMRVRAVGVTVATMAVLSGMVAGAPPAAAAPVNDSFASRTALASPSSTAGTAVGATSETGEPDFCTDEKAGSVWYRYTAPSDGTLNLTLATGTDQSLEVYTGSSLATLEEEDCLHLSATRTFTGEKHLVIDATANVKYAIRVAAWAPGHEGPFTLDLIFSRPLAGAPTNDAFSSATTLTGLAVRAGDLTFATLEATEPTPSCAGERAAGTAWYRYRNTASSGVLHVTLTGKPDLIVTISTGAGLASLTEAACVDGRRRNSGHGLGDYDAEVVPFAVTQNVWHYIAVSGATGADRGSFGLRARFATATPAADNFADRLGITFPSTNSATTAGASIEAGEPDHHCADSGVGTVWFGFTAPSSGTLTLRLGGRTSRTFAVYKGSTLASLDQLTCTFGGWSGIDAVVDVVGGGSYAIAVAPEGAYYDGPFVLTTEFAAAPRNDSFADRAALQLDPAQTTTVTAVTAGATVEPGEPEPSCGASKRGTVWYRFTVPVDGSVRVKAVASAWQATVRVYRGRNVAGLKDEVCMFADDFQPADGTQVPVLANGTYAIAVSNYTTFRYPDVSLSLTYVPLLPQPPE